MPDKMFDLMRTTIRRSTRPKGHPLTELTNNQKWKGWGTVTRTRPIKNNIYRRWWDKIPLPSLYPGRFTVSAAAVIIIVELKPVNGGVRPAPLWLCAVSKFLDNARIHTMRIIIQLIFPILRCPFSPPVAHNWLQINVCVRVYGGCGHTSLFTRFYVKEDLRQCRSCPECLPCTGSSRDFDRFYAF